MESYNIHQITGANILPLHQRRTTIGRDAGNDVVIPKETISSRHAVIEYRDGSYYIEDQRSKNKTRLNGFAMRPDAPQKLKSGDEIIFNKFRFTFRQADVVPSGETVMDFGKERAAMMAAPTTGASPGMPPTGAGGLPQALLIDVANITGRKTITLDRHVTSIGRGVHNDVVIAKKAVSGSHAAINHRAGVFYLEDQRSRNLTRLNGEALKPHAPQALKSGDEIMVDAYTFIFMLEHQMPAGDTAKRA